MEAVERLGGWAVVVWIVWWLTRRWEARMGDIVSALDKHEERETKLFDHQSSMLIEILKELRSLRAMQTDLLNAIKNGAGRQSSKTP